jgi:formylglycine-generating enzyme required for sulfatase activity
MAELASFISVDHIERLFKLLSRIRDARRDELAHIGDVFGDPLQLARFYVEPECQHHNPADRHEDQEPVSQVRAPAFQVINAFLRGDFTPLGDGRTQMFILSDAGMGKTSLLMMMRLTHLMAFWPRGYDCLLLKLGEDTLERVAAHQDKAHTVLLLDALDEDPLAWGAIEARLVALLDATTRFRRVIISCRTQFFPETGSDAFGRPGRVEVGGYTCPMMFLSLFNEDQVEAYLRKRFPDRWHERLLARDNPERLRAARLVGSMRSLRFRPLLLAHIRDILGAGERDWNAFELYRALVDRWLDREEVKLRRQFPRDPPSKETLWRVCTAVAVDLQSRGARLLQRVELDGLTAGFPELASLAHFDVGGRSLLNRNAAGAFRFSHYSIQEFLVVHALTTDTAEAPVAPVRVTAQMLEFLALVPHPPAMERLDLTGLQPGALAGFGFRERLTDGSYGPWMQLMPPGSFAMGSPDEDTSAYDDEKPQHQVTIAGAFALGRYPVTFEEYDRFAAATGGERPPDEGWGRGSRPVINVAREDAVAYCDWLSEQTGRRYHLPTEAQWEYACRAGSTARYWFGDRESDLGDYAWYQGNAGGKTLPVGEKRPNPWGLHDLHGNVWEWVQDAWHDSYRGAPSDGSAWTAGEAGAGAGRVVRGGSWLSGARFCRCAYRGRDAPDGRNDHIGFRCARVQE